MIETIELGAGSYPEPPEKKEKEKEIKIYITYTTTDNFDENWDNEKIAQYIKSEINEYILYSTIDQIEIEVN